MLYGRQASRKMLVVVGLLCLAVTALAAGCGDDTSDAPADSDRGVIDTDHVVEVSHNSFNPSPVTISAGDTVIFRNIVEMSHPLVSEEAGLDTGEFIKGDYSYTFETPGTYTITNTAHANIMSVIVR